MNLPAKKILLWVGLLLSVLVLYSVWKLNATQQQLEALFRTELAPTDTTAGVRVGSIRIEVSNGQLHLNEVEFYTTRDSLLWHAQQLSLRIGTWKSLQMGVLPMAYVLATIDETEILVNKLRYDIHPLIDGRVKLYGSPFDLFPVVVESRFPARSLRMEAFAGPVSSSLFQPFLDEAGYSQLNFEAEEVQLTASIDPSTGRIAINQLGLSGAEVPTFNATATLFYPEEVRNANLSRALFSEANLTGGITVTLPETGPFSVISAREFGSVGFNSLQWKFEGKLDSTRAGNPLQINSHDIRVSGPVIFPQPGALGQLENVLILFGIPTQSLPFESFQVRLVAGDDDSFELNSIVLKHMNFRASFDGSVKGNTISELLDQSIQGTIRLDSMSQEVFNAVTSFEMLLGWSLERDGDALLLPIDTRIGEVAGSRP